MSALAPWLIRNCDLSMKNTTLTVPTASYNGTTTSIPKPFPRLVFLCEVVRALWCHLCPLITVNNRGY